MLAWRDSRRKPPVVRIRRGKTGVVLTGASEAEVRAAVEALTWEREILRTLAEERGELPPRRPR